MANAKEGQPAFIVPQATLTDRYRITIPARFRNRYGIGEGDVVDVLIEREGRENVICLDMVVDDSGRVTVRRQKVDIYALDPGEYPINVSLTGRTVE